MELFLILYYLLFGVIFLLFCLLTEKDAYKDKQSSNLLIGITAIVIILIWPIGLLIKLIEFVGFLVRLGDR